MNVMQATRQLGLAVRSYQGEVLGRIVELIIDEQTGNLSFVALSTLDEEDPGERLMIVPWLALTPDRESPGLLLGINKERVRRAPALERSELVTLGERDVRSWVLSYYGFAANRVPDLDEGRLQQSRRPRNEGRSEETDVARLLEAAVKGLPTDVHDDDEGAGGTEPEGEEWSEAA